MRLMEEQLNPLVVTHLLQHTLRSLCIHQSSQWLYAVFWRILPRNYPPPRWDLVDGGVNIDGMRGNRRNWILAWEDGFCNFAASTSDQQSHECDPTKGLLQPELFFKMSHEIYNYGEGLIGKVAADHSHKWVFKEPQDHGINLLSTWINHADAQPRTWEAQFQSGIMTIALIAVREGVVQLGSMNKVVEDLSFIVQLREKFSYLESIPGVLLPHPSSSAFPADGCNAPADSAIEFYYQFAPQTSRIMPSMSSLEALLSKLPPVRPPPAPLGYMLAAPVLLEPQKDMERTAKEETEDEQERGILKELGGESSCTMPYMSTNN